MVAELADVETILRIEGHVIRVAEPPRRRAEPADHREQPPIRRELLHPVVDAIRHEQVAPMVQCQALRSLHLSRPAAKVGQL